MRADGLPREARASTGPKRETTMKLLLLVAAMFAAFLQSSAVASADVATDWNRTMIGALEASHVPPPPAMRAGAIVQASVFDALNGNGGRYTPLHVQPAAPP